MMSLMSEIVIRACHTAEERQACVDLQTHVWGYSEIDLVPSQLFAVAAETGGQALGAFLRERVIGFSLALVAVRDKVPYLHSQLTAVLPEFQNKGVGRMLKLAQREDGISRGFDLMEWTFDPLEMRNAYFNIVRLGTIAHKYLHNAYGTTSSPLHRGMPTDRLLVEWWLKSPRVEAILAGQPQPPGGETRRIVVPPEHKGAGVQARIRGEFEAAFQDGWVVTGVERSGDGGEYILTRSSVLERRQP